MEKNREISFESVVSNGEAESKMTFYADGHITLQAGMIVVDSVQE